MGNYAQGSIRLILPCIRHRLASYAPGHLRVCTHMQVSLLCFAANGDSQLLTSHLGLQGPSWITLEILDLHIQTDGDATCCGLNLLSIRSSDVGISHLHVSVRDRHPRSRLHTDSSFGPKTWLQQHLFSFHARTSKEFLAMELAFARRNRPLFHSPGSVICHRRSSAMLLVCMPPMFT